MGSFSGLLYGCMETHVTYDFTDANADIRKKGDLALYVRHALCIISWAPLASNVRPVWGNNVNTVYTLEVVPSV